MSKHMQNEEKDKRRVDEELFKKQRNLVDEQDRTNQDAQNVREKPELKPSRIQTKSK